MLKEEARNYFQKEREKLTESVRQKKSFTIAQQLENLIQSKRMVSIFLPILRKLEIDTFSIIEHFPATAFCVPISNFETQKMRHFVFESKEQLTENRWGIPEPVSGKEVEASAINVVVIPMLICDQLGNRVGYGKGFYDRFLAECQPSTLKVGINYFEPIKSIEDLNTQDVQLDVCVTPHSVHWFK